METDLNRIKKLSKEKEDENWEFRSFLKGCNIPEKKIDSMVHKLYKKVSSEIEDINMNLINSASASRGYLALCLRHSAQISFINFFYPQNVVSHRHKGELKCP